MRSDLQDITRDAVVRQRIKAALEEDVGSGDATTLSLVPDGLVVEAEILAREACVVAGTDVARYIFSALDPALTIETCVSEGGRAAAGGTVMRLKGAARAILIGERTALNFMQRMCGIATQTAAFVEKVKAQGTLILDTRKTTPGLRTFEKHAVRCGGGTNHRIGLYDKVLIKDNHRWLWKGTGGDDLGAAVREARRRYPELEIEIEVENPAELASALEGQPDWVLLDNMDPATMADCVAMVAGRCRTEASGGITLANIEAVARSGVDAVSLGCLTHSVRSIDLSLEMLRR
jgi:nicotinate-nucleotide pyrophosphorylase (carboxylating)